MHKHYHVPKTYFLTHSVGCLPKQTSDDVAKDFFGPWQASGGNAWPDWLGILTRFRVSMGEILGVSGNTICPQTNVSSALTKIIHSLPMRKGRDVILLSEQDFPTIGFALKQAERAGYKLKFITGNITDAQVWADAMDNTVAVAHITHALSNTSHLLPVADICKAAKAADIITIVDIAQSVGIVPIHIPDWQADFVIGTSVKFMCGGPGACFMYASDEMIELSHPIDVGWFSHENPFEMDIRDFRYADDAMRFFGGTPSPAPFAAALSAHTLLNKSGIEAAHIYVQSVLNDLVSELEDGVLVSPRNAAQRGGTLVVAPGGVAPKHRTQFTESLNAANILFDEREEGFRFSFHHYTPKEDVKTLSDVLNRL
ncbi:MAG: aminotransferase class V-fold PLP-dependent enzyme [Robiginitomaculum sp.]|nr:aminotransferase class V-fold PLP-dependent enzyme [Robiginitomaculum sp.]